MIRGILVLLCALSFFSLAQERIVFKRAACGFNKRVYIDNVDVNYPENDVLENVKRICRVESIQQRFIVKQTLGTDNAVAGIDSKNRQMIMYNTYFFHGLRTISAKIAILAHEIGHHVNANSYFEDKRPEDELAADRFAGNVLGRLGYALGDARKLLIDNCSTQGDLYYPPLSERLKAMAAGFLAGSRNNSSGARIGNAGKKSRLIQDIDGNVYRTFVFDNLRWTAENLNTNVGEYFCRTDNIDTCNKYGKYYGYDSAVEACSKLDKGWRLPTFLEYQHLFSGNGGGYTIYQTWGANTPVGHPAKGFQENMINGTSGFNNRICGYVFNISDKVIYMDRMTKYWATNIDNNPLQEKSVQKDYFYSFTFDNKLKEIIRFEYFDWAISERNSCRCVFSLK